MLLYIDPSAVTYMIQAVAAVAIAAGAALTVFRHKIVALFRKNKNIVKRREIHLKNGWEGIFVEQDIKESEQSASQKKSSGNKNTVVQQKKYSVKEDLYE